jgi:hypothetical protein
MILCSYYPCNWNKDSPYTLLITQRGTTHKALSVVLTNPRGTNEEYYIFLCGRAGSCLEQGATQQKGIEESITHGPTQHPIMGGSHTDVGRAKT